MFKQLCGEDAFGHVVLCTSMWDNLDTALPEIGAQREKELITRSEFWGTMHTGGSQVVRWLGTKESAQTVVDTIMKTHKDNGKAMLKIQEQMVDQGMSLDETGAGQEAQREMLAAKAELKQEIQQLQDAHREMMKQSNEALAEELASQQKVFEERLAETSEAQDKLKISLETLMEQKEAEYEKLLASAVLEQQQLAETLKEKAAEYERARREQMEDKESFHDAQTLFESEVETLKRKIEEQENLMEKRKLEKELCEAEELKTELERQRIEEEDAASAHSQRIEQELEKKMRRKEKMRDGVAILGVVAGVVSAVTGIATMNPALVSMGASMVGGSLAS
ncbi:hypothetical protein ACHAPA_012352 [Fusarium lateritium]